MMIRLMTAILAAGLLAAFGALAVHADSIFFYMFPGDYAEYTCGGALSATVSGGQAYVACTRKGVPEWDVSVTCFGAVTVTLPGGGVATISCN